MLKACEAASEALSHVLPRDPWAWKFHLWRDDPHNENIFVRENDPSELVAIIDWQSTKAAPLFDHTLALEFLDPDGTSPTGMERPPVPNLTGYTSAEEKAEAIRDYEYQALVIGFKGMMKNNFKPVFDALMHRESGTTEHYVLVASTMIFESG
jgi:hypothetical protein